MKKLIILGTLLAVCLASCSKNNVNQVVPEPEIGARLITIYASAGETTKTNYSGDVTFSWVAGDKISVLFHDSGDNPVWVDFTARSTAASSAFTATVSGDLTIGAPTTGTQWALYPANDNHVYTSDSDIAFAQPSVVDGNTACIPMIAKLASGASGPYHFHQLGGAIKLTIKNIRTEVSRIRLYYNTETDSAVKYLSGLFTIQNPGSDTPSIEHNTVVSDSGEQHYISATANVNSITHQATVYLPLPNSLSAWPYYVFKVFDADKNIELFNKKFGSGAPAITASRRQIKVLSELTLADVDRSGVVQIDGYTNEWSGISTFDSNNPGYIYSWKATSDATNIYFLIKALKKRVTGGRWGSYFCAGYDMTEGGSDPGYGLGSGKEAYTIVYPFDEVVDGQLCLINGLDGNGHVEYPVGTNLGHHITTAGYVEGDYVYFEMSVPRSDLGSPISGSTIKVNHSLSYYPTGEQSITLE